MIIEYTCIVCGKHCRKKRSPGNMITHPKFCSQKCSGEYKSLNAPGKTMNFKGICEQCGKEFHTYRSPSNMKKIKPRFCSLKCLGKSQEGKNNPAYNGGKHKDANGYYVLFMPDHPYSSKRKTILEHRFVMECKIGRYLKPEECVHHIDGNKSNNDPSNLMLFKNNSEHIKHHYNERKKSSNN